MFLLSIGLCSKKKQQLYSSGTPVPVSNPRVTAAGVIQDVQVHIPATDSINTELQGLKKIAHFFSEVWGINKEQVLPTGMPRIDEFLDEEYRKEKTEMLYKSFPVCKNKKVILFAPTYRGKKNKKNAYYPYNIIDFDKLYEACGNEYVILFKVHPWILSLFLFRKSM